MLRYSKPMKQKAKKIIRHKLSVVTLCLVAVITAFSYVPSVFADRFDDEIAELQQQIGNYQAAATDLQGRAATLQNTIDQLQAEQNAIAAQIALKQAELEKLKADIAANEQKLERQKTSLSKTVAQIYVNGSTTPIEVLASSKSVGDYVSSQEVRNSVRNQMKLAMDEVKRLRKELETQKVAVEKNLEDQESQRSHLAAKQSEQANLLAQTRGEEAAYQALIASTNSEIAAKRAAQAAAMAAARGGEGLVYGSSEYPWNDASMAYDDYCRYYSGGSAADPWGYCKRQCVSYVAWKLNSDGRGNRNYSNLGHAASWGYGGNWVSVDDVRPGDVVVWYIGYYGHVMYVDWVSGDMVGISQMNVPYDSGRYSTDTYSKATLRSAAYEIRRFH